MTNTLIPKFVAAGEGPRLLGPGGDISIPKLIASETGNRLSVSEHIAQPDAGPPLHTHAHEDETFYILEGEVSFWVGDKAIVARAGSVVFGPRGVPHTFKNRARTPAKLLLMVTPPANFEAFYACIGAPGANGEPPADAEMIERIMRESPKYGITIHGPSPL